MGEPVLYRVCRLEEIPPGASKLIPAGKRGIGIFNVAGRLYSLANYCPHRGGPLCRGPVTGTTGFDTDTGTVRWQREGEILRCPWHGWEYEIATGQALTFRDARGRPRYSIRSYPVLVKDDVVFVQL